MVYVFEFFAVSGVERRSIDWMTQRARSVDGAKDRAKSMLRNVKIRDQRPDLCLVKDQLGNTLSEVSAHS